MRDGAQLVRRHRGFKPHARRIDDRVELRAGTDDVAAADVTARDQAGDRGAHGPVVERLAGRGEARLRVVALRAGEHGGVARGLELAFRQRAALDQPLGARQLAVGHRQRLLGRAHHRLRRAQRVFLRARLDARQQRALLDGLAFVGHHLQDRATQFRADRGFALRAQVPGDQRAHRDLCGLHRHDVLAADVDDGRRRIGGRRAFGAAAGRASQRRPEGGQQCKT